MSVKVSLYINGEQNLARHVIELSLQHANTVKQLITDSNFDKYEQLLSMLVWNQNPSLLYFTTAHINALDTGCMQVSSIT